MKKKTKSAPSVDLLLSRYRVRDDELPWLLRHRSPPAKPKKRKRTKAEQARLFDL